MTTISRPVFGLAALALALGFAATGSADPGAHSYPRQYIDRHALAGCPLCVSRLAQPSNTCDYDGYYVGGGAAHFGDAPCPQEGTWGWDYFGCHFNRWVDLGWWHGRRDQGGTGAYKTDGPHLRHH